MEIVYEQPPNYKRIAEAFDIANNPGVIFTYGNKLYVPAGERIVIDKPLMAHEEVHARQQRDMGIDAWWDNFLSDRNFRLSQELEAYREQYRVMAGIPLQKRLGYLDHICRDLSGAMYGNMLSYDEAKAVITEGIVLKNVRPRRNGSTLQQLRKRQRLNRKKGRKS